LDWAQIPVSLQFVLPVWTALVFVSRAAFGRNVFPTKFLDGPNFGSFVLVIRVCFALKSDPGR
jgi:hypothetical protein